MPPHDSQPPPRALDGGGASHAHGDPAHDAGEAFPRHAVRDLVGAGLANEARRDRLQTAIVALGLALIALALPTTRLMGEGPALVQWTRHDIGSPEHLLLSPLARALAWIPGLGPESAWFLISAMAWAAAFAAMAAIARQAGMPRLPALAGAWLVAVSPLGFTLGTLPGPSSAAMLGATVLFGVLLRSAAAGQRVEREPGPSPFLVWFAVSLLHAGLLLLLPAVVWQQWRAASQRGTRRLRVLAEGAAALAILIGLAWLVAALSPGGAGARETLAGLWRTLSARASLDAPVGLTWALILLPSFGVSVLGVVGLWSSADAQETPRPPLWIALFGGFPIALQWLAGSPGFDTAVWALGPALSLGLAHWFAREREWPPTRLILGLTAAQLVVVVGFRQMLHQGDPNAGWTDVAQEILSPGDLVITRDPQHSYLLRHRFGLEVVDLGEPLALAESEQSQWWARAAESVRAAAAADRRVAVDWKLNDPLAGRRGYVFRNELHELVLLAPVVYIDPSARAEGLPEATSVPVIEDL